MSKSQGLQSGFIATSSSKSQGLYGGQIADKLPVRGFTRLGSLIAPSVTGSAADFPALVKFEDFTATMLASLDVGGGNLRFSSDLAGATQLACEVVTFTKATGDVVWVKVPSVATGASIYVWGDNTGAAQPAVGDAFGRNAVWVDYGMVNHTRNYIDSSGNGDFTEYVSAPTSTPIKFGGGFEFDGTNMLLASIAPVVDPDSFTLSGWFQFPTGVTSSNDVAGISLADQAGGGARDFTVRPRQSSTPSFFVKSSLPFNVTTSASTDPLLSIALDKPCYVSMTIKSNGDSYLIGKSSVGESIYSGVSGQSTTITVDTFGIGGRADSSESPFAGIVAEPRYRTSAVTTDFISIEYDNQSATGAWWTAVNEGVSNNSSYDLAFDTTSVVSFPDTTVSALTSWYVEFELRGRTGSNKQIYPLARVGNRSFYIQVNTSANTANQSAKLRLNATDYGFSIPLVDLTEFAVFRFEADGSNLTLHVNGDLIGTHTGFSRKFDSGDTINSISNSNGTRSTTPWELRRAAFNVDGIDRYYDPSATGGTGSVLKDTVGNNDGALVGFPTNDSQWVEYDNLAANFTLLGSLQVPASAPSASSIDLDVRKDDFTTAMLAALDVGGGDLRFSADVNGLTPLACDVYQFNKTSGDLVKVNVPSASAGSLIYVWGDNTGAIQPDIDEPFGRNATYTDSVWELGLDETSGTSALDRSGTIDGTYLAPLPLLGPNDGQLFTDDSGAKVNRGSGAISRAAFTKKATVLPQNISAGRSIIACDVSGSNRFWNWQINSSGFVALTCWDASGTIFIGTAGSISVSTTVKSILHFVFTGTHYRTYVNGVLDLDIASTTQIKGISRDVYLGDRKAANTTEFRGEIFHASIKESADDANYISLQNDNQSATGAWWTATNAAGGAVTVPVTGVQAATAVGNVTIPSTGINFTVTGVQTATAVGNVAATTGINFTVTGVQTATAVGNVAATTGINFTVTGVQAATAVGNVAATTGINFTVTGVQAATAVGNVVATTEINSTVTGVQAAVSVGNVTAASPSVTVAVTGVAGIVSEGNIQVVTSAFFPVTGVQATLALGNVETNIVTAVPVTGVQAFGLLGNATVALDTNVLVTGVEAFGLVGGVNVWGIIPTAQNAGWQENGTTQTPNWKNIGL